MDQDAYRIHEKLSRAMQAAAAQSGVEDGWKHYDRGRNFLVENEEKIKCIRRVIGRRNPEAMFRELSYQDGTSHYFELLQLEWLENYGFDSKVLKEEVRTAQKLMIKGSGKLHKCYAKELKAAQAFAWLEERSRERRYREWGQI